VRVTHSVNTRYRPVSRPDPNMDYERRDQMLDTIHKHYGRPVAQPAERERLAALLHRNVTFYDDTCTHETCLAGRYADRLIAAGVRLSGDDEGLRATGAALRAAIDAACSLNNPRLSEVDWDQVAKVWGER
jgi:hypothetical protein